MKKRNTALFLFMTLFCIGVNIGICQECMIDTTAKSSSDPVHSVNKVERIQVVPDSNWAKRKGGFEYDKLIRFYKKDGKLKKQIIKYFRDYVAYPPTSKDFIALFKRTPEIYGELNKKPYIVIYGNKGNELRKVEIDQTCGGAFYISDNKSIVLFGPKSSADIYPKYHISIYDSTGLCIKNIQPVTNYSSDNNGKGILWNNQYFIAIVRKGLEIINTLKIYDLKTGNVLITKEFEYIQVNDIKPVYSKGTLDLTVHDRSVKKKTLEIDMDGNIISEREGW